MGLDEQGGLLFIDGDCQSWDLSGDESSSAGDTNGMCGFCWTDRRYGLVDAGELMLFLLRPTPEEERDLFSNSSQDLIMYRPIIKNSYLPILSFVPSFDLRHVSLFAGWFKCDDVIAHHSGL